MKIAAVYAETLALEATAPFAVASSLAHATHGDADLPRRSGGSARDLASGRRAELRDGVSAVVVPGAPRPGITSDVDATVAQRVERRW